MEITQGNFISGERVVISYSNTGGSTSTVGGTDQNLPSREIIRGGSRIEPILYNQKGWNPPTWEPNLVFQNWARPAVGDYTRDITFTPSYRAYAYTNTPSDGLTYLSFPIPEFSLTITQQMADDDVDLNWEGFIFFGAYEADDSTAATPLRVTLYKNGSSDGFTDFGFEFPSGENYEDKKVPYNFTLSRSYIQANIGSTFTIYSAARGARGTFGGWTNPNFYITEYKSKITQSPSPGQQPNLVVPSNIWVSASNGTYSMYTTQSDMVSMFTSNLSSPAWYMKDISGSGYNPILTYWGIERGDIFRFEGDETKTYMVNYVETGSVIGNDSINVYFGDKIPSSLNINRYSLTRYVDDASKIVVKGYRPSNSTGPYIVRPEYVVPELNKGIDEFIVDLTQKGLL